MENRVFLNIDTRNGFLVIPFIGLKELDYFTVGYEDEEQLIKSLDRILDLSLNVEDVLNIYITGNRYKNTGNSSLYYIKYSDDNYNVDTVREKLSLYLKEEHDRIRRCDIRFVVTEGMIRFNAGLGISDNEIDWAVKAFLNGDYKKNRDMYFLTRKGISRKNEKLKVDNDFNRTNLTKLASREDDFVQYIIELASKDEEGFERAISELGLLDLEDINRSLGKVDVGLLDGLIDEDAEDLEDIYSLEVFTGMSIDEIKGLQTEYQFSSNGRRR